MICAEVRDALWLTAQSFYVDAKNAGRSPKTQFRQLCCVKTVKEMKFMSKWGDADIIKITPMTRPFGGYVFCPACGTDLGRWESWKAYSCDCLLKEKLATKEPINISKEVLNKFISEMDQRFIIESYLLAGDHLNAAREIYKLKKGNYPEEDRHK